MEYVFFIVVFFFSSRRRHTRSLCDWSSDVCSSDLQLKGEGLGGRDPNEMYELAVTWMEARRLERQLEQLDDQLPFESPERQASLIAEKRRVFDELRKRYPRYKIAARRRGAPGT